MTPTEVSQKDAIERSREEAPIILFKFGEFSQIHKAIEELSELISELARTNRVDLKVVKVQEEIADAINMIFQMRRLFGPEEVDAFIHKKLDRTLAL